MFALLLAVTLTVSPDPVYIEREGAHQSINCDLIIAGADEPPDEVHVSVYDKSGALVLRRFVDGNGTRPSIRTIDVREAAPRMLVFNPFHTFDADVEIGSMKFEVKLGDESVSATIRPRHYEPKAKLILPLKGRQLVWDGHDFLSHHRRWDYTIPGLQQLGFRTNFMRYSYDFVPVDADGNMFKGDESKNESWLGFGRELRAAAAGTVVSAVDAHPDDRRFTPQQIVDRGPMAVFGNYVVIDHGSGEFSVYGHIKQGSARLKPGQRVNRGDVVAAVGASGSSMFPHLHYELQTGPDTNAEGLPSTFHDFERVRGARRVKVSAGSVNTGEILEGR
ncbi:MAG TPA: M23 family metallopeptidase [Thermoanaerobaculia bacterium]